MREVLATPLPLMIIYALNVIFLQQMHIRVADVYEDLWSKDFHRLGMQVKFDSSRRIRVTATCGHPYIHNHWYHGFVHTESLM